MPGNLRAMLSTIFLLLLAATATCVSEPVVEPLYQQVMAPASPVVQCTFPQSLSDCKVRVVENWNIDFNNTLDFGRGQKSPSVPLYSKYGRLMGKASYAGSSLAAGHCGVRLELIQLYQAVLVVCLGWDKDGVWTQGVGVLTATRVSEPVVEPLYQQVMAPASPVVQCTFPQPLSDCRVRVLENWYDDYNTTLEFGRGQQSPTVQLFTKHKYPLGNASYAGSSLDAGHCGVGLNLTRDSQAVLVECFGRAKDGYWMRGFGLLAATPDSVLTSTTSTPLMIVARRGETVSMQLKVQTSLNFCYVKTPASGSIFLEPGQSPPSGSRYEANGAGIGKGECGFRLRNVQPADAGVWFWYGYNPFQTAVYMALVVVEG